MKISHNKIEIITNRLELSNAVATLSFYDLDFITPRILRNGNPCPDDVCEIKGYSNGNLVFSVDGFSTFTSEEDPEAAQKREDERKKKEEEIKKKQEEANKKQQEEQGIGTKQSSEPVKPSEQDGKIESDERKTPEIEGKSKEKSSIIPIIISVTSLLVIFIITFTIILAVRKNKSKPKNKPAYIKKEQSYNFNSIRGRMMLNYIQSSKAKGSNKTAIRNELKRRGWPDNIIKQAFKKIK